MHFAQIENDIVVNIIEAEQDFIDTYSLETGRTFVQVPGGHSNKDVIIGSTYDSFLGFRRADKPVKLYELTFDMQSNEKKVVSGMSGVSMGSKLTVTYERNAVQDPDVLFSSQRGNSIKKYYKASKGEAITAHFPDIVLLNPINIYYAELIEQPGNVVSREWYLGVKDLDSLSLMCRSLGIQNPSGEYFERIVNDPEKYKYRPEGIDIYDFWFSIEYDGVNQPSVDYYATVYEEDLPSIETKYGVSIPR